MPTTTVTAAAPQPSRVRAPTPRVALVIFASLVLGVVLYLGRSALTPFILGALLIYILDPLVGFLSRRRFNRLQLPRWIAVLIVYALTFFIVFEAMVLLLVPLISQLGQFVGDLPRILSALEAALAQLREFYQTLNLPPAIREYLDGMLADIDGAPAIDLGGLLPLARTILGTAAGFFGFIIIPVWAFYILRDRVSLTTGLFNALPPAWRGDAVAVVNIIDRVVGRWIRAQLILGLIIGVATYVGLLLLGNLVDPRFLQFAVLLAVIAGVLELLPIIGPIISMIPTLLIALTTAEPVVSLLAVVALYTVVQQVENAVLVPKIQGEAVELHPSLIITALIVGGAIAGLVGAILSIPITAAALSVFRYLFRRLSADDPGVAAADAPDMLRLTSDDVEGAEGNGPPAEADHGPPADEHGPTPEHGPPAEADHPNRHLSSRPALEEDGAVNALEEDEPDK